MAEEKTYPMTSDGKAKLEAELETLKTKTRAEVIERIKIARSFGDLSENSEYESAKDEQAFIEGRISTIEHMLQNAEIIDSESVAKDEVSLGRSVTFKELPDEEPETYTIVGQSEADPMTGKISNESPIAVGLLGHKLNEEVTIKIPSGDMKVKIISVD
ncbi:transcription elongation factor GreA [Paucilactobacillus kaifaensis]|uniref:transcription elongation factor GreA n=1 Tax=Paucilactobacillus kaifaensis TaxID=2559921 RepID=UPI0010FA3F28|nr:transcription elongation factor GreA [Paucilactobacillus kaifaensis]